MEVANDVIQGVSTGMCAYAMLASKHASDNHPESLEVSSMFHGISRAVIALLAAFAIPATMLVASSPASADGTAAQTTSAMTALPSTSNRCVNQFHTVSNGCWATTLNAGLGNQGCPNGVPLFLRSGGKVCIGGNDLVLITCWFTGNPAVGGDTFQDHVVAENSGSLRDVGHIPDFYINLNGHFPNALEFRPNIPPC